MFVASETPLNDLLDTIRIDVYVNYQGTLKKRSSYIVPINQEDIDESEFM